MSIFRRWILALVVLLVAIGVPAFVYGPPYYSQWKQERLLRRARQCLERKDVQSAVLLLRRLLYDNAKNVDAARGLAEIAEMYLPGDAPEFRARVCRLIPHSYPDAKAWALVALRVGEISQAADAFELMDKVGTRDAAYFEIGGRIAMTLGHLAESRDYFRHALELDPTNESDQLDLASLEVRLPDPAAQVRAREKLQNFRANPKFRHAALRALVGDRLEKATFAEAFALADEFVNDTEATFQDRLQYLGILRSMEDPNTPLNSSFSRSSGLAFDLVPESPEPTFASYLNRLEEEAAGNAWKVSLLVAFLNNRGLSLLASEWTQAMPPAFVSRPPVAPPLAESYRMIVDYQQLEEFIADQYWGDLEFMRLAYSALVLHEKGDRAAAAAQWAAAIKAAEYRPEPLDTLARFASAWHWPEQFEEILWITAEKTKRPREALMELARIYQEKRDTPKLFTIWSRLLDLAPDDRTVRTKWVRLSLLLKNERYRTGAMAQELYQQHPEDSEIATNFALVLHFRLQDPEALAVMKKLTPEQLRESATAGYYGIILLGNQRLEEAAESLLRAADAPLLQEEIDLMDQARRTLDLTTKKR